MEHNRGVVYIAFGPLYLVMALFSIKTLRRKSNDLPVMILTNIDIALDRLDFWRADSDIVRFVDLDTQRNRAIKTDLIGHAPFQNVAYIDSDTYILKDINRAWLFLDHFDLALKLNPKKQKRPGKGDQLVLNSSTYVRDLPHFNSGVIFFRQSNGTRDFFNRWSSAFESGAVSYDQVSLIDALFQSSARLLPLTEEWNYFPDVAYFAGKIKSPHIVHYTNRISFALERELLYIASSLKMNIDEIERDIKTKRLTRKEKIGRRGWWKLLFYWTLFPGREKQRWQELR